MNRLPRTHGNSIKNVVTSTTKSTHLKIAKNNTNLEISSNNYLQKVHSTTTNESKYYKFDSQPMDFSKSMPIKK